MSISSKDNTVGMFKDVESLVRFFKEYELDFDQVEAKVIFDYINMIGLTRGDFDDRDEVVEWFDAIAKMSIEEYYEKYSLGDKIEDVMTNGKFDEVKFLSDPVSDMFDIVGFTYEGDKVTILLFA